MQIFNEAERHNRDAISINMMSSLAKKMELACEFGDTLVKVLTWIFNLCISNPTTDIVIHANNVKSCF